MKLVEQVSSDIWVALHQRTDIVKSTFIEEQQQERFH